jgi:hypothetical protein
MSSGVIADRPPRAPVGRAASERSRVDRPAAWDDWLALIRVRGEMMPHLGGVRDTDDETGARSYPLLTGACCCAVAAVVPPLPGARA